MAVNIGHGLPAIDREQKRWSHYKINASAVMGSMWKSSGITVKIKSQQLL
jgi:hypothetical protein